MAMKATTKKRRLRPRIALRRVGTTKSWQDDTYIAQIGEGMRAVFGNGRTPAEALGELLLKRPRLLAARLEQET